MSNASQERFEELIDDFNTAMLVTQSSEEELRSRPMTLASHEDDGSIFFATKASSGKVDEILEHPGVNISMQSGGSYLSVTGQAELVNDQEQINELWDDSWKLWFEEGKEDPSIVLIKVHATEGEFWNFDTKDKLEFLFEAGKAILTEDDVDYDAGEHGKVAIA